MAIRSIEMESVLRRDSMRDDEDENQGRTRWRCGPFSEKTVGIPVLREHARM
jgi:hypothetical protein